MLKPILFTALLFACINSIFAQLPVIVTINLPTNHQYEEPYKTVFNGKLYFFATDMHHRPKLMVSDGTQIGTQVFFEPIPGTTFEADVPVSITATESLLFFSTIQNVNNSSVFKYKLWRTDGTTAGTYLVKEMIHSGIFAWQPGKYFFTADDGVNGNEMWVTDGTTTGTSLFKDINPIGSSYTSKIGDINGNMILVADDGVHGAELWVSDGTVAGTQLLKDIKPGINSSIPSAAVQIGTKLYFTADDGAGKKIWHTDGTTAGTQKLAGSFAPNNFPLYAYNNKFYISGADTLGSAVYVSDGTDTGTHRAASLGICGSCTPPNGFCGFDDKIYFAGDTGNTYNIELWSTNGTDTGTRMVKDIYPGGFSSYPRFMKTYKKHFYFHANKSSVGSELYQSNGTQAGTIAIMNAEIQDSLLFNKNDGALYAFTQYSIIRLLDTTGSSAVEHLTATATIALYPNPAHHNFTIKTTTAFKAGSITLTDVTGRVVKTEKLYYNEQTISLQGIAPGIYMADVWLDDKRSTQKLIVQ